MIKKKIDIFQVVSIIVIIFCVSLVIKWFIDNQNNKKMLKVLTNQIQFVNDESNKMENIDFTNLLEINPDTVGWVKVKGTNINYSVVKGNDNSFYLKHTFNKKYNSAGWIFADYKNKMDGTDDNIILYGHSRGDGSMFYTLRNTLEEKWWNNESNHIIYFYTPKGILQYKVFSVYDIPINEIDLKTDFAAKSEYKSYLESIEKRSKFIFDTEVTSNDKILTLSTCSNGNFNRIVLHAKLIN